VAAIGARSSQLEEEETVMIRQLAKEAVDLGVDVVVRLPTSQTRANATEILAYGTAVRLNDQSRL